MFKTAFTCCLATAFGCGSTSSSNPSSPDGMTADGSGPTADAAPLTTGVSTLAGTADAGDIDGARNLARFSNPVNVLRGPDGTIFVADFDNGSIRAIDSVGNVSTALKQTGFVRPFGMAFAADGSLFASTDNGPTGLQTLMSGTIWRIDLASQSAVVVATNLGRPRGLVVLADGRLAMADDAHHVIQLLDPATGTVTVLAGTADAMGYVDAIGPAARFNRPYGIATRPDGMLVVTDFGNERLRLVDVATGTTTTLAGSGAVGFLDGTLATAQFSAPQGIAIDAAGDIFITDTNNYRIRRISGDAVLTVAGNGVAGYLDNSVRDAAELYGLEGLTVSPDGSMIYVADGSRGDPVPYNRVREIDMTP
jgi:glucose/arabinose dehydrogenase